MILENELRYVKKTHIILCISFKTFFLFLTCLVNALASFNHDESVSQVYNNRVIRYLDDLSDSISLVRDEDRLSAYRLVKDLNKGPTVVFMHQREE